MFIKYLSSSCIRSDHFLFFLQNFALTSFNEYFIILSFTACSNFLDFQDLLTYLTMKSAKCHISAVITEHLNKPALDCWYFTQFIPLASSSFLSFNRECEIYIPNSKLSVWPLSHLQFQLSKCPSKCLSSSLHSINIKIKHSSGLFDGKLDIDI